MRNVQGATAINSDNEAPLVQTLDHEADELEAIRVGLLRHLDAWRGAHEATIGRLADMIARMDAVLARMEQEAA